MAELEIKRTAKLFIGGAFPRSESGRTYEVFDKNKQFLANVTLGSKKDARDAVTAARSSFSKWSQATAYNRGQVLYRVAEIMQGRREQFVTEVNTWSKTKKQAEFGKTDRSRVSCGQVAAPQLGAAAERTVADERDERATGTFVLQ